MRSCSQEAALPLRRAGQDLVHVGAALVRPGAVLVRPGAQNAALPSPRAGQEKLVRQNLPWCAVGAARIKNWCARIKNWCARNFLGAQDAALPSRRAGQENLVLPGLSLVRAGAARNELGAPDFEPWCARSVHHQNAALPSRRAGQCFQNDVPCSKHGWNTRSINFLGFLARHSTLVPCFFLGPCSILVACMGDIFPLIFFLGEPDTALVEGRARFSSSWFQGTLLCSALVVGRAELPSLFGSLMLPS
ncbi:uncharacterized protein DS421_6g187230 [Arachis hypogaea]|nr:uncharacterized protein DS421_6g187230 [Arachis hypogaea]